MKTLLKLLFVIACITCLASGGYLFASTYPILAGVSIKFAIVVSVSFPILALSMIGILATIKWIIK